jgi:hypothetical protein
MVELPSCALDDAGLREQRARYRALSASVTRLDRTADTVLIEFDEGLDRTTLDRALAVERQCCPFFTLEFDESKRLLRVGVREAAQLPALDAIAAALGAAGS